MKNLNGVYPRNVYPNYDTKLDPAIEAYKLGLLADTQQLVGDQMFGQNVQNLRKVFKVN